MVSFTHQLSQLVPFFLWGRNSYFKKIPIKKLDDYLVGDDLWNRVIDRAISL